MQGIIIVSICDERKANVAKNGHGLAKILSKGLETEIHYQEISANEARDLLKSKNFSKEKVEKILALNTFINSDECRLRVSSRCMIPSTDFKCST